MRRWILPLTLLLLITLIQRPLWFGKGGWYHVQELQQQLDAQREKNHNLETRNAGLAAEVHNLKSGQEAIEERARFELGLIRKNEYFVHLPRSAPAGALPPITSALPSLTLKADKSIAAIFSPEKSTSTKSTQKSQSASNHKPAPSTSNSPKPTPPTNIPRS